MLQKILAVNQGGEIAVALRLGLREAGLELLSAQGVASALNKAQVEEPSVILLDLTLPTAVGLDLCRKLKSGHSTSHIPVVLLAYEATPEQKIAGLEAGADDFVAQPFSYRQIILRLKNSILRHAKKERLPEALILGELRLDRERHEFAIRERSVDLTPMEFKLMARLMEKQGQVLVRDMLLDIVWGMNNTSMTRTIDTTVSRLRRKLGTMAQYLETIRGVGYRLSKDIAYHQAPRNEAKLTLPRVNLPLGRKRQVNLVQPRETKRTEELAVA
jgi:two-component system phosphate regulon response regulator PhoB